MPKISREDAFQGKPSDKVHRSDHAPLVISKETQAEHERQKGEREVQAEKDYYAGILPDPSSARWYDSESKTAELDHG